MNAYDVPRIPGRLPAAARKRAQRFRKRHGFRMRRGVWAPQAAPSALRPKAIPPLLPLRSPP
eukprot:10398108-Prorocentrum_lima.AAC.1